MRFSQRQRKIVGAAWFHTTILKQKNGNFQDCKNTNAAGKSGKGGVADVSR